MEGKLRLIFNQNTTLTQKFLVFYQKKRICIVKSVIICQKHSNKKIYDEFVCGFGS